MRVCARDSLWQGVVRIPSGPIGFQVEPLGTQEFKWSDPKPDEMDLDPRKSPWKTSMGKPTVTGEIAGMTDAK